MKIEATSLPEVLLITPNIFHDERGFFMESYNLQTFAKETGIKAPFVQDNHSKSSKGILRGIHYQVENAQGKLVRVVSGAVYDVAVDLRKSSAHFGKWVGVTLTDENHQMLWVPPGFGHAFLVLSDTAEFLYKTTDFYAPEHERCIHYRDPSLEIDWPTAITPILSEKDEKGCILETADLFQ